MCLAYLSMNHPGARSERGLVWIEGFFRVKECRVGLVYVVVRPQCHSCSFIHSSLRCRLSRFNWLNNPHPAWLMSLHQPRFELSYVCVFSHCVCVPDTLTSFCLSSPDNILHIVTEHNIRPYHHNKVCQSLLPAHCHLIIIKRMNITHSLLRTLQLCCYFHVDLS